MNEELRILMVEDRADDALLVARALRTLERPFTFRQVADEADFRRELAGFSPEIVLSDLAVPGFPGLRALALAREGGVGVPFIFVSGTLDGESAVDLLRQGATDYVQKDHLYRLVPAIQRALREAHVAQEHLRAEENYRGIFENAVLGIYQLTPDGHYVAVNPAFARLLGYDGPAEMLAAGTRFSTSFTDPKKGDAFFGELSASGEVRNFEAEVFRCDRSRIWIACHARIVPPAHGAGALCEGFVEDLTRHREMEARVQRARRLESIGTLAGGVAHDLNNVLAPILVASSMLRTAVATPEHRRMLAVIEESAEHGKQIIKQVGAFGSGGDGQWRTLPVGYLLKDVLKVVADTFPNGIALESTVERGLPALRGDAAQLRQALLALCTNARDAMPEGGTLHIGARHVELTAAALAALSQTAPPGRYVVLEVRDTGTGIPPEIVDRIFDPFFTTKGIGKGTGLGLSEVCGLIKQHGGFIEVASTPGSGSTFQMYLPAAVAQPPERAKSQPAPETPAGQGQTILLVDDEELIRVAVSTALAARNYRVITAANGIEALQIYTQKRREISVVVTDLMMPQMDGVALSRALRRIDPQASIIISSGRGDKARDAQTGSLGFQAMLDKPYAMDAFLRTLQSVLHPERAAA